MCYRTCVSTSLAIACISKCILSMKYYSIKRCVEINLRIRHWLVLFPYRNQKYEFKSHIYHNLHMRYILLSCAQWNFQETSKLVYGFSLNNTPNLSRFPSLMYFHSATSSIILIMQILKSHFYFQPEV